MVHFPTFSCFCVNIIHRSDGIVTVLKTYVSPSDKGGKVVASSTEVLNKMDTTSIVSKSRREVKTNRVCLLFGQISFVPPVPSLKLTAKAPENRAKGPKMKFISQPSIFRWELF